MAELQLNGVSNRFLRTTDVNVSDGELFVIVGPSGAGKTSLLKVIAGLASHEGAIKVDGQMVHTLPPYRRSIGYVSQDLHLFPHLDVEGNLEIAMERLGWTKRRRRERASELMALLRIRHLSGRKPPTFSGGEKQRAALARVLASAPQILLLDEPFSNLDFRTARYLRSEFKHLQRKLRLTTLLVTHNIEEARFLADTLAVMSEGRLVQVGRPAELLEMNQHRRDSFLDAPNLLTCTGTCSLGNGLVEIQWAGLRFFVPDEGCRFSCVAINGCEVEIDSTPPPGPPVNRFEAVIREVGINDDSVNLILDIDGNDLRVEMTPDKWQRLGMSPDDRVHGFLRIKAFEVLKDE